jgi:hypothetical protein
MIRSALRLLLLIGTASFLILIALTLAVSLKSVSASLSLTGPTAGLWRSPAFLLVGSLLVCIAAVATCGLNRLLKKLEPLLDSDASAEAHFLDTLNASHVDLAILFSAALSLFLELALIRWQSSVLEFLAFYKNFTLLACFAGLGLGYSLATRSRIPLIVVLPLLTWQFIFMLITRVVPSAFHVIPFREQLTMGFPSGRTDPASFCCIFCSR